MNADVRAVLALARGRPDVQPASWSNALEIAVKERCAALAWHRSGAEIRRLAPADIVQRWRSEAIAAVDLAAMWEAVLARTLPALRTAGVEPVVLKGLPLGMRLYGTTAARPSADLDLFVRIDERRAAHRALLAAGWRWRGGEAPFEGGYEGTQGERTVLLEVHSSLLDDSLVRHLPVAPPSGREVRIGSIDAIVHDDDQLPAFLAAHLAKHAMPPLLWLIDFAELWEGLHPDERNRARAAARSARAARYLEWAIRRSALVVAAGTGSDQALGALGYRNGARSDVHSVLRVAALAATPGDALAAIAGWAAPSELRSDPLRLVGRFAWRGAKFIRRDRRRPGVTVATGSTGAAVSVDRATRALTLGSADFSALASELAGRDCAFWIRASGASMQPSIPSGAAVRLVPVREQRIAVGDVVLADLGAGRVVLHRVRRVSGDALRLQGDANVRMDRAVTPRAIVARADAVRLDGRVVPVPALGAANTRGSLRRWALRIGAGEAIVRAAATVRGMRGAVDAK